MAGVDVLAQKFALQATLDYICEPRLGGWSDQRDAAPAGPLDPPG